MRTQTDRSSTLLLFCSSKESKIVNQVATIFFLSNKIVNNNISVKLGRENDFDMSLMLISLDPLFQFRI